MDVDQEFLRSLRVMSIVEGTSTLVLFGIAMPLKYSAGIPSAVSFVGAVHGVLFVALVVTFGLAVERVPISWKLAVLGSLAAVVPFGPFLFDRRLAELSD